MINVTAQNFAAISRTINAAGVSPARGDAELSRLAAALTRDTGTLVEVQDVRALLHDWQAHEARFADVRGALGATFDAGQERVAGQSARNVVGPMSTRLAAAAGRVQQASGAVMRFAQGIVDAPRRTLALAAIAGGLVGVGLPAAAQPDVAAGVGRAAATSTVREATAGSFFQVGSKTFANDVVANWAPGRLFAEAGALSPTQIESITATLKAHPHWNVFVMTTATYGSEAAFNADRTKISYELVKGGFGKLKNAEGKADGAWFFVLVKSQPNDRGYFSYSGSEAQANAGFVSPGSGSLAPELQNLIIPPLKAGRNVPLAVENLISHIDTGVARAAAKNAAAQAAAISTAQASITATRGQASAVATAAAAFLRDHMNAPIATVPTGAWQAELTRASSLVEANDIAGARRIVAEIAPAVTAASELLTQHAPVGAQLSALAGKLSAAQASPYATKVPGVEQAAKALEAARQEHVDGALTYRQAAARATTSVTTVSDAITSAETRDKNLKLGIELGGLALILGGLAAGAIANRKRKGPMDAATAALAAAEKELRETCAALLPLLERSATEIGSIKGDVTDRFIGETRDLALKALEITRHLATLGGSGQRYIALARATMEAHPFLNKFQQDDWVAAVKLLKEPVAVDPTAGVEFALREVKGWKQEQEVVAAPGEPVSITFANLMETIAKTSADVTEAIDTVVRSRDDGNAVLAAAATAATTTRKQVAEAQRDDGLFAVAGVSAMLDAAATQLDAAGKRLLKDPVGALQKEGAAAQRLIAEAGALASLAQDVRAPGALLEKAASARADLAKDGHATAWIDTDIANLSARFNEIARTDPKESVRAATEELRARAVAVSARISTIVRFGTEAQTECRAEIDQRRSLVADVRATLAKAVGVNPELLLAEEGNNPGAHLSAAEAALTRLNAAIDKGDVKAATAARGEVASEAKTAQAIVEETRQAYASHAPALKRNVEQTEAVKTAAADAARVIQQLAQEFVPSALAAVATTGTLSTKSADAQTALGRAAAADAAGRNAFAGGRLLAAKQQLDAAQKDIGLAAGFVAEVTAGEAKLRGKVTANTQALATLRSNAEALAPRVANDVVRKPARDAYSAAKAALASATQAIARKPNDPVAVGEQLASVAAKLEDVDTQVKADKKAHASANEKLESADGAVQTARRWSGTHVRGISGDGGLAKYTAATAALTAGNYESAARLADEASKAAAGAVKTASDRDDSIQDDIDTKARQAAAAAALLLQQQAQATARARAAEEQTVTFSVSSGGGGGGGGSNNDDTNSTNNSY